MLMQFHAITQKIKFTQKNQAPNTKFYIKLVGNLNFRKNLAQNLKFDVKPNVKLNFYQKNRARN